RRWYGTPSPARPTTSPRAPAACSRKAPRPPPTPRRAPPKRPRALPKSCAGCSNERVSAEFLNRMLEAERAGARALVVFMDDFDRNSAEWKLLRGVHDDEAHNCALIGEQIRKLGRDYSHATGEFYGKAVAVKGSRQRIEFLVKGLQWAIRQFDQAL